MERSIIFDLDGTLITCENKQKYALYSILKRNEDINPYVINEWWTLKQNGYSTEKALCQIGIPFAYKISQEWARIIEDFTLCLLDNAFEDSLSTLEFLKDYKQFRILILTARKSRLQVIQTIHRIGFHKYVDDIIDVSPQNSILEKTKYLHKIKPEMFIGDTESDYEASINSKTRFIALNRGQRNHVFLKNLKIPQIENNLKFLQHID